jgi:hypothetical protein
MLINGIIFRKKLQVYFDSRGFCADFLLGLFFGKEAKLTEKRKRNAPAVKPHIT